MDRIETNGVRVDFNATGGILDHVEFDVAGTSLAPLHRAPWHGTGELLDEDLAPHLKMLAGDFLCAPFGASDIEPAPAHGLAANGRWIAESQQTHTDGVTARYRLDAKILGAELTKEIGLRAGHPIIYQRHIFRGGRGKLPVAHHAMLRVPGGARLSFSPKIFGATPARALEPDASRGRSILAYPQRFADLSALRLADGGSVDARSYPFADRHEDFVQLFEVPGTALGWTAALAARDGFLFFAVKDAHILPSTVLWMSNRGRDYEPWRGRHRNVIGLEEACTYFGEGHRASAAPNAVSDEGIATALALAPDRPLVIRYAFGAILAPPGWTEIRAIAVEPDSIVIEDAGASHVRVPFDGGFFGNMDIVE